MWPSAYPADTVLDFFTYAGAPGAYSLNLGPGAGLWWSNNGFSVSANYVSFNGNETDPTSGGIATDAAAGTGTVQLAYADSGWGVAAAYTYSSGNWGTLYQSTGTPLATQVGLDILKKGGTAILKDKTEVPVSESNKDRFLERFFGRGL